MQHPTDLTPRRNYAACWHSERTTIMTDLTRRNLIGAAATIAAAGAAVVALPAAAQSVAPIVIPTEGDAWDRLIATLSTEQRELLYQVEAEITAETLDEQQAIIDEVKRHAPSLAMMLQLTYGHVAEARPALRGICCTPADTSPGYV
jgi:hypothetical protein